MGSGRREEREVPKREEEGGCESRKQGGWEARKEWVCCVWVMGAGTAAHISVSGGWRSDWKRHEWRWREERGSRSQEEGGSMHMSMLHKPLPPTPTLVVGGRSACRFHIL